MGRRNGLGIIDGKIPKGSRRNDMATATLKTVTLGCKVNQYETEWVRQGLLSFGYRDAGEGESADVCVVNTCTVTSEGDAKSRQIIRRMAKDNPGARIVVMGCYATRAPDEVAKLPGVYEVVADKRELHDLLGRFGVTDAPVGVFDFQNGKRQRAFVKVQDGCLLNCSFCIIPQVRPHFSSRLPGEITAEVAKLAEHGCQEIVLAGIHLGHYGVEQNQGRPKAAWVRLSSLIRDLTAIDAQFRIRLSSIEATEVTRELLEAMAEQPRRVCPHLHVSMQSGSDSVLHRMRRRWGAKRFVDRCRLATEMLDLPALTTDVIVGFPGETEAEFQETLNVCDEVGFSKIHIFPFSPRPGTDAATMPDQVHPEVKKQRTARLRELEGRLRRRYLERLVGRRLDVMVEGRIETPGLVQGTSCRFAQVELPGSPDLVGRLLSAVVVQAQDDRVQALPDAEFSPL